MSFNAQGPAYEKKHHTTTFVKAYQLGDASDVFALGNTGESVRYTVKKNGKGGRTQSICPFPNDTASQSIGDPPKGNSLAYNDKTKEGWLKDGFEAYKSTSQYANPKIFDFKNRKLFMFAQALNEVHDRFHWGEGRSRSELPSLAAIHLAEFWADQCLAPVGGTEAEHAQRILAAVDAEANRIDPWISFNRPPKPDDALRLFRKIRRHLTETAEEGWKPLAAGNLGVEGAERTVGAYINAAGNEERRSERLRDFQEALHLILTTPELVEMDLGTTTSKAAVRVCEAKGDKDKIAEIIRSAEGWEE